MAVNLRRRLERLTGEAAGRSAPTWAAPDKYARLLERAREDIADDVADGWDPIYRIENGVVYSAADGSPIRDSRDYMRVFDGRIRELQAEIAEEEEAAEGGGGLT